MTVEDGLKNPIEFEDPKVQYFSDLWWQQRKELTAGQKDNIGRAYLTHIIGADEETVQAFIQGSSRAQDFVGLRQGGAEQRKGDYSSFWNEVAEITSDVYTREDLSWLIETGISSVWHIEFQIEEALRGESLVIRQIRNNAHAYK